MSEDFYSSAAFALDVAGASPGVYGDVSQLVDAVHYAAAEKLVSFMASEGGQSVGAVWDCAAELGLLDVLPQLVSLYAWYGPTLP